MEVGSSDTEDLLLRKLGGRLLAGSGFQVVCDEILSVAVAATRADGGSLELFGVDGTTHGNGGALRWRALSNQPCASPFPSLLDSHYASSSRHRATFERGERIVVPMLLKAGTSLDENQRMAFMGAGVASLFSTPIRALSGGRLHGIITLYWEAPHQPLKCALRCMDELVRQGAAILGSMQSAVAGARSMNAMSAALTPHSEAALPRSEERLQRALQAGEVFAYEWICGDDTLIRSPNCSEILGAGCGAIEITGRDWKERIHVDDRGLFQEAIEALRQGSSRSSVIYRHVREDGTVAWLQESCAGERDAEGRLLRVYGLVRDITARKRADEMQQLLIREFDHRARNMLATIQAMILLTARTQTDVGEFVISLQNRIRSMARAHALIAGSQWSGASVHSIVRDELDPYVCGRAGAASICGEDVTLTPGATMALVLAMHELVTNAAKDGALSVAEGCVHVAISRDAEGALVIEWQESGGPELIPPRRRGFGSQLIESSIRSEVGGSTQVHYLKTGLECTITIPGNQIVARSRHLGPNVREGEEAAEPVILLVGAPDEGEQETVQRLESFGYQVQSVDDRDEAVRAANQGKFAAAILDINFGEKEIFSLVDILAGRDIPLAFVVDRQLFNPPPRYRHCPVLTKPLRADSVRRVLPKNPSP
ncbi:MAG: PAS domain-containing protein [Chromatiales bacterium]|jgi:PAS domain S-box-containing protein|nr:PAS domain-containing protein [Chromatiales bacterium]